MKGQPGQIRQGDILLVPVKVTPPENPDYKNEVCLAEGELTGHAHRLIGEKLVDWSDGDNRYVMEMGNNMGSLMHEDHDPEPVKIIEPGITYRVIPQQEVSLSGQWRRVVD